MGAAAPDQRLQWGRNPAVVDALKRAVRRVADQLKKEKDWLTLSRLVAEMRTSAGAGEAEEVLGIDIGQVWM